MTIGNTAQAVISLVGALGLTVAGSVGVAWLAFRYLGDKWISARFNERLEAFKHVQQQEIERLRLKINTTFDRTIKLHGQEYDVLPELWMRLAEAYSYTAGLLHPLQTYPDLDRMTAPAFEHFLAESGLPDYQKDELRTSSTKTKAYQSLRFWQSYGVVSEKVRHFRNYLLAKGIFVPSEIKAKIEELDDFIYAAMLEKESEERDPHPRPGRWEQGNAFRKEGKALRDEIEAAIQKRLWDTAALPAEIASPQG